MCFRKQQEKLNSPCPSRLKFHLFSEISDQSKSLWGSKRLVLAAHIFLFTPSPSMAQILREGHSQTWTRVTLVSWVWKPAWTTLVLPGKSLRPRTIIGVIQGHGVTQSARSQWCGGETQAFSPGFVRLPFDCSTCILTAALRVFLSFPSCLLHFLLYFFPFTSSCVNVSRKEALHVIGYLRRVPAKIPHPWWR